MESKQKANCSPIKNYRARTATWRSASLYRARPERTWVRMTRSGKGRGRIPSSLKLRLVRNMLMQLNRYSN